MLFGQAHFFCQNCEEIIGVVDDAVDVIVMDDNPSDKGCKLVEYGPRRSETKGEDKVNVVFSLPLIA